jgi:abortive infection bacteriophage resistance protein
MEEKEQQDALSVKAQTENLKSLNLAIADEQFAFDFLNDISYFRFIKAYSLELKKKNGNYYDGVTFEQLVELYLFNSNFRQLLFPQIERVEINLRCRISNLFSERYGVLSYKESDLFRSNHYHNLFLRDIEAEIRRNRRAPFIRNFHANYTNGEIPLYALIEIFSFGTLSKFYKNMLNVDKKEIAKMYSIPYPYFESWIESIAYVRNLCAHYGRLYNAKLSKTPKLYQGDIKNGITSHRIYGILICLKHILPENKQWHEFIESLDLLLKKYPFVEKQTMGFPESWKELLSQQKEG